MRDVDLERPLEGGMNVEMWRSHADKTQVQIMLQQTIWEELRREPEPDIADVSVEVEQFVARLSGWVPSNSAKLRLQCVAERVPGIASVMNDIAIKR